METQNNHILQLLESSFLFCGLNPQTLQELAQKARIHTYRPHHILIEEDILNDKIIIITSGMVKIYKINEDGREIFLGIEKSPNYLGIMDLDDKPGSATIETLQPTTVLILHKKDLLEMLNKNPILWERMYKITLAKLRELNLLYSIRLGNDVYQRTYLLLRFLSYHIKDHTVALSHESLASIVAATRPRVTEALHALRNAGKITISSKKITVN